MILPNAKTILVVEDDKDIQFALKMLLESEGYIVKEALNGSEAMQFISTEGLPNLILLDMTMPIMNGWEFAAAFHAKYDQSVPIIVMTAAADAKQRSLDVKAAGFVAKPFKLEDLTAVIQKHIQ